MATISRRCSCILAAILEVKKKTSVKETSMPDIDFDAFDAFPPRELPEGATLPPWLEEVTSYYKDRDHMIMMTRAEIDAYEGNSPPMSDDRWNGMGVAGGSNWGHPFFRIKA
jgi:hypothetical protein